MRSYCFITLLILVGLAASSVGSFRGNTIKSIANSYVGSTRWSRSGTLGRYGLGPNTNKCYAFVGEVLEEARVNIPRRFRLWYSPVGGREWAHPSSPYLVGHRCFRLVSKDDAQVGDVIAGGGHIGIVTGTRLTTSANSSRVVRNDWGFRSNSPTMVCWRVVC